MSGRPANDMRIIDTFTALNLLIFDVEEISQAICRATKDTYSTIQAQIPEDDNKDYVKVKAQAYISHIAAKRLESIIQKHRFIFETELVRD